MAKILMLSTFLVITSVALIEGVHKGYKQEWLRGEGSIAGRGHVHEGLRLEDGSGWVGIGHTLAEDGNKNEQVMVRRIDNVGTTVWTAYFGDSHATAGKVSNSVGLSIVQDGDLLYIGTGMWQKATNTMKPTAMALDAATGSLIGQKVLGSHPRHGAIRGIIVDEERIICTGYVDNEQPGFLFVADGAKPAVWEFDKMGNLVKEKILTIAGLGQGAKIRKDHSSNGGFIMTSTAWATFNGKERNSVALVKFSSSLDVEWSQMYGLEGGASQVFDMLVDQDGNYLMGGHTTVGPGVINWDYLALKVNSKTKQVEWRNVYGQPRGFNATYVHDEMYGVALDASGNYILLGGSGDEGPAWYNELNSAGWKSKVWVSYLVVVDTKGKTLYQNVYGDKAGNNAGEHIAVDNTNGDLMIFVDSDTKGGFGFMKLSPN